MFIPIALRPESNALQHRLARRGRWCAGLGKGRIGPSRNVLFVHGRWSVLPARPRDSRCVRIAAHRREPVKVVSPVQTGLAFTGKGKGGVNTLVMRSAVNWPGEPAKTSRATVVVKTLG